MSHVRVNKLVILMAVFLAGCAGIKDGLKGRGSAGKEAVKMVVPLRRAIPPAEVPDHVKLATSGLVLRMRHQKVPGGAVVFKADGSHRVREEGFDYDGFRWTLLDITALRADMVKGHKVAVHLEGLLHFTDSLARMSTSSFSMDYLVGKNRPLEITASRVVHVKPGYPRVKAYFVPLAVLQKNLKRLKTYRDYYIFAATHFVPMYASDEQIRAKQSWDELSTIRKLRSQPPRTALEGDWAVMVFCLDRLAPDSGLDIKVISGTGIGMKQVPAKPALINEHGWRALVLAGHGNLHDSRNPFKVEVYYRMAASSEGKPLLVGRFDSRLDYSKPPGRPVLHSRQGPLGLGKRLLDPRKKEDARIIQQRLKELGYYKLKIDGSFGPGSRASLRAFNREVMNLDRYRWDLEVQKALFKDSGR